MKKILTKVLNGVGIFFAFFLCAFPLIFKAVQDGMKITVDGAIIVNALFIFACLAGVLTARDDRHLSLASLSDRAPEPLQGIILRIRAAAVPAILTAFFFAAFSETFLAFLPTDTAFGVPKRFIFAALPVMYLCMLFLFVKRDKHRISSAVGIAIGLLIATGPISGVLYSIFGLENLNWMYAITDKYLAFSTGAFIPLVVLMIALAIMGVPLYVVIGGIAYLAFSQGGGYVEQPAHEAYTILTDKTIITIPLFTIAGYVLAKGSAGERFVRFFKALLGSVRGGTVIAAVLVATIFTTFTGVSGVTILALGGILSSVLVGTGYKKEHAESLITSSGAIGLLFPPSLAIIMYGTTNYFSVNVFDLFLGSLIPGAVLAIAMITMGVIRDKEKNRPKFSLKGVWDGFTYSWLELLMPVLVLAGYFAGFFSLVEVASFAAVYSIILETFIRKDLTVKGLFKAVLESIPVSGGVLIILSAARGLSFFMIDANIPNMIADATLAVVHSKILFLLILNALLLVVGCLMDIYSAILIISPLIIPVAESFGINPVHIGVIFLMNLQLGFLTPPVGMDLFISSYTFNRPIGFVVKNVLPFLAIQFLVLMLVTYVPWFTTALLAL